VRSTAPEAMVLVVDDHSPAAQAALIAAAAAELDCAHVVQDEGEGPYAAFNVGLSAGAQHGMDVCLVGPDLVFDSAGWLGRLTARTGTDGAPAAVAGGAIIEPDGLIRQAGFYFSLFRRAWGARHYRIPEILLDVERPLLCPVDAQLLLIRNEWIEVSGGFDEDLTGPHGALDFCLRVSAEGGECIFEPTVRARALETDNREPDDDAVSAHRLRLKHANTSFQKWAPEVI
jgi:GT2 family glycosyltransferase